MRFQDGAIFATARDDVKGHRRGRMRRSPQTVQVVSRKNGSLKEPPRKGFVLFSVGS